MSHIIEFAGPPGSGKTTRCHYFIKQLRQSGYRVAGRMELRHFIRSMNRVERLWLYAATVLQNAISLIHFCAILLQHRLLQYDAIFRYARWCLFNEALRKYIRRYRPDYVLLDQWALQDLWSATIFGRAAYGKLAEQLKSFGGKRDAIFYIDVDPQTAAARISLRRTAISRFDAMNDGKRFQEIKKWSGYLFTLYHSADCRFKKIISGSGSAAQLAPLFFYHLDVLTERRMPANRFPVFRFDRA